MVDAQDIARLAHTCKPVPVGFPSNATTQAVARALLDEARKHYLLAIQACVVAGIPNDELAHDEWGTHRAASQLLALAGAV